MKKIIAALLKKGEYNLLKKVIASIDYAHEVYVILTSDKSEDEINNDLQELVRDYKSQSEITCPLMESILKLHKIDIENVQKALDEWKATGKEPC